MYILEIGIGGKKKEYTKNKLNWMPFAKHVFVFIWYTNGDLIIMGGGGGGGGHHHHHLLLFS